MYIYLFAIILVLMGRLGNMVFKIQWHRMLPCLIALMIQRKQLY